MLRLITREEVERDYVARFGRALPPNSDDLLRYFPPYILHYCLSGRETPPNISDFFVGDSSCRIEMVKAGDRIIRFCFGGFPAPMLGKLGLGEYEAASPPPQVKEAIQLAFESFAVFPEILDAISSWISVIVYLRPLGAVARLSSTSFYELPHCSFITRLAARFLPPNIILPFRHPYPIQENLYHEALHQWLCREIGLEPLIRVDREARLNPSWKNGELWSLEHSIQACFVYAHVAQVRRRASKNVSTVLEPYLLKSADSALASAKELLSLLNGHEDSLTPRCIQLLSYLEDMAA